jgi:hypothetical protein
MVKGVIHPLTILEGEEIMNLLIIPILVLVPAFFSIKAITSLETKKNLNAECIQMKFHKIMR